MAIDYSRYRDGGDGMINWVEDFAYFPVHLPGTSVPAWIPVRDLPSAPSAATGRSYKEMWKHQKGILREALQMKNGEFIHRLICLCWMRGEGKTAVGPALIHLWKFFIFPKQSIMLCANSKEQTKFIVLDVMKDTIRNSPHLIQFVGGNDNLQVKEIRLKNRKGEIVSIIRAVSSYSGVLPNITGYAFSEVFKMKTSSFFEEIDGSIRNIPNAFGIIDSTVSKKNHFFYRLYQTALSKGDPSLYFSYRCSPEADYKDFWHPQMGEVQLSAYKSKFTFGSFAKFFMNNWEAGTDRLFPSDYIEAISYIGTYEDIDCQDTVLRLIKYKNDIRHDCSEGSHLAGIVHGGFVGNEATVERLEMADQVLKKTDDVYRLHKDSLPCHATSEDLERLTALYDTDWAILVGMDRADPSAIRSSARTMLVCIAKGLKKSRSEGVRLTDGPPKYIYFLLHIAHIIDHSMDSIKREINMLTEEYGWIDKMTAERFGLWDIAAWCEAEDIPSELIYSHYTVQKDAYNEMYMVLQEGRFKAPEVYIRGSKTADIFREELTEIEHEWETENRGRFYSPEKNEAGGVQDDTMYATVWGMYGGRFITADDFKPRIGSQRTFGSSFGHGGLLGDY